MKQLLKLGFACIITLSFHLSSYSQIITRGLIGYWPCTGSAYDSSGFQNHGMVTGATLTVDRFGNKNSAYSFDGDQDYIDLGDSSHLRPKEITVNLWFKHGELNQLMSLIDCKNTLDGEWGIGIGIGAQRGLFVGASGGSNNSLIAYHSDNFYADNQWHMATFVYDTTRNETFAVYVDGVLSGYHNTTGSSGGFGATDSLKFDSSSNWYVGVSSQYFNSKISYGPYYFEGDIDDISMYNRPLSSLEVHQLFKGSLSTSSFLNNKLKVYPNPSNGILYFENEANNQAITSVKVLNCVGETVYEYTQKSPIKSIDLSSVVGSGIYFLEVMEKESQTSSNYKILIR